MPFLSQVVGCPVLDPDGLRVGVLHDLLVMPDAPYPAVAIAVVRAGKRHYAVPWSDVASVTPRATALRRTADLQSYGEPTVEFVWLRRDVLDKQIVDTTGVRLVRVNDIVLTPLENELRAAGVDAGAAGLLRRLGLGWAARPLERRHPVIDWEQIDIGTALDVLRLKEPYARLARMRPADIATVVSQMSPGEAADLLEALDEETAARAMAELPDEHQATVLSAMEPEEAADVLDEMQPDEAADVLGDVEEERAEELMKLMEPAAAREVRDLLAYREDTAGGLMSSRFVALKEADSVDDVINELRRNRPEDEDVYAVYVTDASGRLRGALSLRDLIVAHSDALIADIMEADIDSVRLEDPQEEVARKLLRYDLLAIPVVDGEQRLKGVVTVDDVFELVTPRAWRNLPRRMRG